MGVFCMFDISKMQYFCDTFVELLNKNGLGLEVERSVDDGHIALHFYDSLGRAASRIIKLWILRYDYNNSSAPVVYSVTCLEKSDDLLSNYSKLELRTVKDYYDMMCKICKKLNSFSVPLVCYEDDSLLNCLKRSYAKYGKRLKVVEV